MLRRSHDPQDGRGGASRVPVLAVAAIRVALGAGMLGRPALLPRTTGLEAPTADRVGWLVRMMGSREVALGLGALASGGGRGWVAGGVLSDAGDTVTLALAARDASMPRWMAAVATATSAGAVAVGVQDLLRRRPR